MMSHASAAKVGTPSTLTPSAAIPSLIVGERRCAVAKSNLKRRNVFSSDFCQEAILTMMGSADDFPLPSSTTACPIDISVKQAFFEVTVYITLW